MYFLDINPAFAKDPASPCAVLPIPYERTVTFGKGCARGPWAILEASQQTEDFDEELQLSTDLRVETLPAPRFARMSTNRALETIRAAAEPALRKGRFLLSLGGEHTVTLPLVTAAKAVHKGICVLHIDAHADLRRQYTGTGFSHACVGRRIAELGVPVVMAAIRSVCVEEHQYIRANRVPVFWAHEIAAARNDSWIGRVIAAIGKGPVYLTVDIDAFDPSLAPGTGTPEPGGLNWRQMTALLRRLFAAKNVVAADIVETTPIPGSNVTEFVAARLGAKILTYHKFRNRLR